MVEVTHPLGGHYASKQDLRAHTFARHNKVLPGGILLHVEYLSTASDWAVVVLRSHATAKNGMRFDNPSCGVTRFESGTIVEFGAYLDSALVQKLIDGNER